MRSRQIAEALRALAQRGDGRLTPEAVVDAAKDISSPLHEHFTWDDRKAAHEHRLDQARVLIRSVKVEITTNTFSLKAPEFVHDPAAGKGQGYVSLGKLRTDADLAREAVVSEFSRAAAALTRAKAVAAALNLSEEIDDLRGRVVALSERVQETSAAH